MLLFVPVGLFGVAALVVVLGLTVLAPIYAVIVLLDGRYLLALFALLLWFVWLRFGGRLRHLVLEGFEHGSL
jgi:hypothetical protein